MNGAGATAGPGSPSPSKAAQDHPGTATNRGAMGWGSGRLPNSREAGVTATRTKCSTPVARGDSVTAKDGGEGPTGTGTVSCRQVGGGEGTGDGGASQRGCKNKT